MSSDPALPSEKHIPVRYRREFRDRAIPYGTARELLEPGDVVLYAADSYVYHTVRVIGFRQLGGAPHIVRAEVEQLPGGATWSVDPDDLFAWAEEREIDRRTLPNINTSRVRQLDAGTFTAEYFQREFDSFVSMHPRLSDVQAQLASQGLKTVYEALSREDQMECAVLWDSPHLAPYRNAHGAEIKPGMSPDETPAVPKSTVQRAPRR